MHPGATAILEAKAQQLVGGKSGLAVPAGQNAMDYFFDQHKIQMSLGYCISHDHNPDTKYVSVELPAALAVTAAYGMSVLKSKTGDGAAATRFALFMMTPEAQGVIAQSGFVPVAESQGEQ